MGRRLLRLILVSILGAAGCQPDASGLWFDGGLDAAREEAATRGTVIMIEFYTDWCSWCRRLETDTFSAPGVHHTLERIVALRMNAELKGSELAERFSIESYPTMVFLDSRGHEIDRIIGYMPPDAFLGRIERIRAGDTFFDCLRELDEHPGNVEAITKSVEGLLQRSDPEGAISRIKAFQRATAGREAALWRRLMFTARGERHDRIYRRAARLFRSGWTRPFDVPEAVGTANLSALLAEGLEQLPSDHQASLLRQARYDDAVALLEDLDLDDTEPETLLEISDFAFRNGHYDVAAELYTQWYEAAGTRSEPEVLNNVAWSLYLARRKSEVAITIARQSYASRAAPQTADTLARLLYVTGAVDEAIALETTAARGAEDWRSTIYDWVVQRMKAGEPLDDAPSFESYPGQRRRAP